jgi:GT2 family glycosyltransferase
MDKDARILIPFHNSVQWIRPCLEAIKNSNFSMKNVIIANDRSSVSEKLICTKIAKEFGVNKIIDNEGRPGFGGCVNYAIENISSEYILVLNSDCLIAENTIESLRAPLANNSNYFMSCPISNNSPNYSFKIPQGMNFKSVASCLHELYIPLNKEKYVEAATVVGNCLMVKKTIFQSLGGFGDEWGIGYGEETDLQFKGMEKGYKSILVLDTYVYHFGGGSFKSVSDIDNHRQKNHKAFMRKWGNKYKELTQAQDFDPILLLTFIFANLKAKNGISNEVIFYMATIDQQIGGIHSIVDICNHLISNGINATCALMGKNAEQLIDKYKEPIYFTPLCFDTEEDFINASNSLNFKIIVSTIHTSAEFCSKLKSKHIKHLQYIQGLEYMFETGGAFQNALNSYKYGDGCVFASKYLETKLTPLLPKIPTWTINPNVNQDIFYKENNNREFFLGMCLRRDGDKGQGFLLNLLLNKRISREKIIIFGDKKYDFLKSMKNVSFIELPISREILAKYFRKTSSYIDLTAHEGYGLMGKEAIMCGCNLFYSNYGGLNDYVEIEENFLINDLLNSDIIIDKLIAVSVKKIKNQLINLDNSNWVDLIKSHLN